MKIIVRDAGNIGPFDEIETLADDSGLRCYRNGVPEDYAFVVLGEYTVSEDPNDAPVIPPPPPSKEELAARAAQRETNLRFLVGVKINNLQRKLKKQIAANELGAAFKTQAQIDKLKEV